MASRTYPFNFLTLGPSEVFARDVWYFYGDL
jgi:hypothetical protein